MIFLFLLILILFKSFIFKFLASGIKMLLQLKKIISKIDNVEIIFRSANIVK